MNSDSVSFGELFCADLAPRASLSRYASGAVADRHRHERSYVCLVLNGAFIQHTGTDSVASAGHLVVLPSGRWHSDVVGSYGALCLNLHLSEAEAERLIKRTGAATPAARRLAGEVAAEIAIGVDRDPLTIEGLVRELVGALNGSSVEPPASRAVFEVIGLIEAAPAQPWRLGGLARRVGLHPTHLAREFRRRTGSGIGDFRRRRALTALCLDLRSGKRPLVELALDHGFADQSHMSRAVHSFTGFAPAKYRHLFRGQR